MGKGHTGYRTAEIMDSRAQEEQIQEVGSKREAVFHFPHLPAPRTLNTDQDKASTSVVPVYHGREGRVNTAECS